jgi:hypothetical protein
MRSGRKLGIPEPSALNDVLGDALLRRGAVVFEYIPGVPPGEPTVGALTPISISSVR